MQRPLFFVDGPDSSVYPVLKAEVEAELVYLIDMQDAQGAWYPNWNWGQYDEVWEELKPEIAAMVTANNLLSLRKFCAIQ